MLFSRFVKESIEKLCFTKVKAVQILDAESLWSPKMTYCIFTLKAGLLLLVVFLVFFFCFVFCYFFWFLHYSSGLPMLD